MTEGKGEWLANKLREAEPHQDLVGCVMFTILEMSQSMLATEDASRSSDLAWGAINEVFEEQAGKKVGRKMGHANKHFRETWIELVGPIYHSAKAIPEVNMDKALVSQLNGLAAGDWEPRVSGLTLDAGYLPPVPHLLRLLLEHSPLKRDDTKGLWPALVCEWCNK